jgi:hypothetical protein
MKYETFTGIVALLVIIFGIAIVGTLIYLFLKFINIFGLLMLFF